MREITPVSSMSAKEFGSLWAPKRLLEDYGKGLTKMTDSAEFDFRHDTSGARIELKAARARVGPFTFQYIRPECFDICVCLGWAGGEHRYWVLPSTAIRSFLSKQHRSSSSFSFQLRVGPRKVHTLTEFEVAPSALRVRVDALANRWIRNPQPVRLNPILATVEGWARVAKSITRQLRECRLSHWSFVIEPLPTLVDPEEPDLLPYPDFIPNEWRIVVWVHPKPVIGRQNIRVTAACLFDFLLQYLDQDDPISVAEPEVT